MIPLLKVRVRHDCDTALILRFPRLGVGCIPWSLPVRGGLTLPWDGKSIRSESDVWCSMLWYLSPSVNCAVPTGLQGAGASGSLEKLRSGTPRFPDSRNGLTNSSVLNVKELAKRRSAKLAQIAIAWSAEKTSTPSLARASWISLRMQSVGGGYPETFVPTTWLEQFLTAF